MTLSTIRNSFLFFLGFSAFCFYAFPSYAEPPPIGQVIWVKGTVQAIQPRQSPRLLQRRAYLFEHDEIVTSQTGSGQIAFIDSSTLILRPNTRLKIDEFHYKKGGDPAQSRSIMNVIEGGFRTITGVIPKENPEGYQVNTPMATIGVRGTDYSIYIDPIQGLLLNLNQGVIKVQNPAGSLVLNKSVGMVYGVVNSVRSAPAILHQKPAVFSAPPGGAGKPQTVRGFCVGG